MDYTEFASKVKAKYPGQYDDMDDRELAEKLVQKYPSQYADVTFDSQPAPAQEGLQRFLPAVGATIGGLAATPAGLIPGIGTAIRSGAAGLGGAAGEGYRQVINRIAGNEAPQTSAEAAKRIGKEALVAGATEAVIPSALRVAGKVAKPVVKTFANVGEAVAGTPARNLVRSVEEGLRTYFPKGQTLLTRSAAGEAQARIENKLFKRLFKPEERVALKLNQSGLADKTISEAMIQQELGLPLNPKQAVATVQAIDAKFPTPTAKNMGLSAELSKLRTVARQAVAEKFGTYDKALKRTSKAITRSQLLKPFKVNRSNPDKFSGFSGALAPMIGGATYAMGGDPEAALAAALASSPLAFGTVGALAGSIGKAATSKIGSRAMAQSIAQALTNRNKPQ